MSAKSVALVRSRRSFAMIQAGDGRERDNELAGSIRGIVDPPAIAFPKECLE
jgi:hypothetical protein